MLGFDIGDIMKISINSAHSQKSYGLSAAVRAFLFLTSVQGFKAMGVSPPTAKYYLVGPDYNVTVNPEAAQVTPWQHLSLKNLPQGPPPTTHFALLLHFPLRPL